MHLRKMTGTSEKLLTNIKADKVIGMSNLEITRLKKENCSELTEFLNAVFTAQNGYEMHFENLYPRIFKESDKTMGWHLAAKDSGKICGVVASYPFKYHIGDRILNAAAMGNVAVDTNYRGQGIMQMLMKRICLENKEEGIDLCYLHGDRWRYRNFGFERCGTEICFHIKASMLREHIVSKKYRFEEIAQEKTDLIDKLFSFYNTQKTYEERKRESFYEAMTAKGHITYVLLTEDGTAEGYITVTSDKETVIEIALNNSKDFADVFKAYIEENAFQVIYVNVPEYNPVVAEAFKYADRYVVFQPGNFLVLNFKNVVEAFMREKCKYTNLPDGVISINSDIFGKWSIKKDKNIIEINPFEGEADFTLDGYSVYQFLFGTLPLYNKNNDAKKDALIKAWLPLPLYCPYLS